jgi:hypothetical protein
MSAPRPHRLQDVDVSSSAERVPLQCIARAYASGAAGSWLVMLGILSILPVPGIGMVLGVGITAVAMAMWRSPAAVVLPRCLARIELSRRWAQLIVQLMARLEAFVGQPPGGRRRTRPAAPVAGWMAAIAAALGVLIFLPIPLGNVLPALALICLGLAAARADRAVLLLGLAAATLALLWPAALAYGAYLGGDWLWGQPSL